VQPEPDCATSTDDLKSDPHSRNISPRRLFTCMAYGHPAIAAILFQYRRQRRQSRPIVQLAQRKCQLIAHAQVGVAGHAQ
jgi:hypothetical protein